jgi:hypothetical protein
LELEESFGEDSLDSDSSESSSQGFSEILSLTGDFPKNENMNTPTDQNQRRAQHFEEDNYTPNHRYEASHDSDFSLSIVRAGKSKDLTKQRILVHIAESVGVSSSSGDDDY